MTDLAHRFLIKLAGGFFVSAIFSSHLVYSSPTPSPEDYRDEGLFLRLGLPEQITFPEVIETEWDNWERAWAPTKKNLEKNKRWKKGYEQMKEACELLMDIDFQKAYLSARRRYFTNQELIFSKLITIKQREGHEIFSQMRALEVELGTYKNFDSLNLVLVKIENIHTRIERELSKLTDEAVDYTGYEFKPVTTRSNLKLFQWYFVTRPTRTIIDFLFSFSLKDTLSSHKDPVVNFRNFNEALKTLIQTRSKFSIPIDQLIFVNKPQILDSIFTFLNNNLLDFYSDNFNLDTYKAFSELFALLDNQVPGIGPVLTKMILELHPNILHFFSTLRDEELVSIIPALNTKHLRKNLVLEILRRDIYPSFTLQILTALATQKTSECPKELHKFSYGMKAIESPVRDSYFRLRSAINMRFKNSLDIPVEQENLLRELKGYLRRKHSYEELQRNLFLAAVESLRLFPKSCIALWDDIL